MRSKADAAMMCDPLAVAEQEIRTIAQRPADAYQSRSLTEAKKPGNVRKANRGPEGADLQEIEFRIGVDEDGRMKNSGACVISDIGPGHGADPGGPATDLQALLQPSLQIDCPACRTGPPVSQPASPMPVRHDRPSRMLSSSFYSAAGSAGPR